MCTARKEWWWGVLRANQQTAEPEYRRVLVSPLKAQRPTQARISGGRSSQTRISVHRPTETPLSVHRPRESWMSVHRPLETRVSAQRPLETRVSVHRPCKTVHSAHRPVETLVSAGKPLEPRVSTVTKKVLARPSTGRLVQSGKKPCTCKEQALRSEYEQTEVERRHCPMCNSLLIKRSLSPIRKSVEQRLRNLDTFGDTNEQSVTLDTLLRASARNQLVEHRMTPVSHK